ncbi:hypothetical protein [Paraglaciecola marina]|uniref:hypothetical protein n=1 Tax=Paraglaciecola marina TaxID=2500157 RepID=UPI00105E0C7C|nr:hypothetical protein [Paraglaciecola marina]
MSDKHFIDSPLYKKLSSVQQAVDAVVYLAEITPIDDPDSSAKLIVANRLKKQFEKLYLETLQIAKPS